MKTVSLTWLRSLGTKNEIRSWLRSLLGHLSLTKSLFLDVWCLLLSTGWLRCLLAYPDLIWGAPWLGELSEVQLHQVFNQVVHLFLIILETLSVNNVLLFEVCEELPQVLEDFLIYTLILTGIRGVLSAFLDVLSDVLYYKVFGVLVSMDTRSFLRVRKSLLEIYRLLMHTVRRWSKGLGFEVGMMVCSR